ncbi:DNA helicase II [Candidatus Albibeggiatoa sp. nov. NOAA]|uniref:DNA helicase II n=1 Tax=Candidatus Albibeggiatoa sp. nov. NOAA TaxID=3162724 RepID=UPI0032FC1FFC|nr:DNA helicase II [Thiotrichaceae bacterium]
MDDLISDILTPLNKQQRDAVAADLKPVLVIAGAGTGKTRVLVHRIAFLIATNQSRPHNILAVTFTNKAAREMQQRIQHLIKGSMQGLWVGTFHGTAHRLLRTHYQEANLPQNFQILDSDDQLRVIKRIVRTMQLDEKVWIPKEIQYFINHRKEQGLRAKDIIAEDYETWLKQMIQLYAAYEADCQRMGVVDFSELLLRSYELFRDNEALLFQYQQRFKHILVDEFQDTNSIQYAWLRLLTGSKSLLFVVGDDDQSIYGWRGAKIEHIQQFADNYTDTQTIRLEQNYRSTGTVLAAANALIDNNPERLGKNLWTEGNAGEPIYIYTAYNEIDEADFVASQIEQSDRHLKEIAILYRTSAQSRVFEEAMIKKSIPYRIYGGLRFYERAEIKDVLAYLRLILHKNDDSAFERIINTPKRGIGDKTVEAVRQFARQQGIALWEAANELTSTNQLNNRATKSLNGFLELILQLEKNIAQLKLNEQVLYINEHSGLIENYKKAPKEEAQRRIENLEELVTAAKEFEASAKDGNDPLSTFLAHAALESGDMQASDYEDCVQMMTLHLAKGLEFEQVFLCGLEEGLFPHENTIKEGKLDEERRLCYVGITRAKQVLYLCHSETRMTRGLRDFTRPSRFIHEIPAELTQEVRMKTTVNQVAIPRFEMGNRVKHPSFGAGIVTEVEGSGDFARILVNFEKEGQKWLMVSLSGLELC